MTIKDKLETSQKYELVNLSGENPDIELDKKGLERLVILPNYSTKNEKDGIIPYGVIAEYNRKLHNPDRKLLGGDYGCGITLARFEKPIELNDIKGIMYLIDGNTNLGIDVESHFISFYESVSGNVLDLNDRDIVVLIHSGSKNRRRLLDLIRDVSINQTGSNLVSVLELSHTSLERDKDKVVYRKGALKLAEDGYGLLNSPLAGRSVIVKGNPSIRVLGNSVPFGTGKILDEEEQETELNFPIGDIHIGSCHCCLDSSNPRLFRKLDEIITNLDGSISVVGELRGLAYREN